MFIRFTISDQKKPPIAFRTHSTEERRKKEATFVMSILITISDQKKPPIAFRTHSTEERRKKEATFVMSMNIVFFSVQKSGLRSLLQSKRVLKLSHTRTQSALSFQTQVCVIATPTHPFCGQSIARNFLASHIITKAYHVESSHYGIYLSITQ